MTTAAQSVRIQSGTYAVDPVHSSVGFRVKHFGVSSFRGAFPDVEGEITVRDGEIVEIRGTVRTESIRAQDDNLTAHLKSDDFFAVEAHPTGAFRSTSVTRGDGDTLHVEGEITLRGVTRPLALDVEIEGAGQDPYGKTRLGLTATGALDRTEFGISWNAPLPAGGMAVSNKVKLVWHVEAILA